MNKFILSALLVFGTFVSVNAQTAKDFTAPDCSATSRNLFTELNAGKIIVMVWVMPCGSCISDAKASYDAVQSFATSNPGRVLLWLADDNGGTSCSNLASWATSNGINTANATLFGNAGNVINEADYGGSGMPHVMVVGGMNHKIYMNKLNGSNDGPAITAAINQALTTGIAAKATEASPLKLYPNPAQHRVSIDCMKLTSPVTQIEIYNVLGEKIQTLSPGIFDQSNKTIDIELSAAVKPGNYYVHVKNGDSMQRLKFCVVD
jgi:hypothetical protein